MSCPTRTRRLAALLLAVVAAIVATLTLVEGEAIGADQATLAGPLAVASEGERTSISFAVSGPTDVEVAVLDAKGNVVRHLAAGVLGGKNPPPAPLAKGLAQKLAWDGRDDDAKPAQGGPFRVRLRIGMQVKFGRMIGGNPTTGTVVSMPYRAPVNGLVVDGEGQLYVKLMSSVGSHGNSGLWPWHIRRFDREGKYQKTLFPYPPSTPAERASGFTLLDTPEGNFTPANQSSLYPVFAALGNEIVPRLAGGEMVFVHSERRQLNFLALDGTNRLRTVTMWPAEAKLNCPRWLDIQVALSPDGRWAYYSNVAGVAYDGKTPDDIDAAWPQGRVYRQDLSREGSQPEKFFDLELPDFAREPYWMPSAWDKKSATAGIDTDAKGNVLVCDLVNQAVVEIAPDGRRLSTTKVDWPDRVLASRKSDAIYVFSRKVSRGHLPAATLTKIVGRGDSAKVAAELPLSGTIGGAATLDESGERPTLWLAGGVKDEDGGSKLVRVEDRGGELVIVGDNYLNRDADAIRFVGYMDVDREAELVYVTGNDGSVWRYEGESGRGGLVDLKAVDVAIGPGGAIYAWGTGSYEGPVARYSRALEPIPLGPDLPHTYGDLYGRAGRGKAVCGLDVDRQGRVFATFGSNDCHVRAYDAEGKLVEFERKIVSESRRGPIEIPVAVAGVVGYGGSIRLDAAGNIYLLQYGFGEDHAPPMGSEQDEAYKVAVGTIYKFGPGGGELKQSGSSVREAIGATVHYAGCGPVSRWRADGACACVKPRFDVDDFGRLYIPNGITYQVSIRDNADNEIVRFGGYGNYDSQGPTSAEPRPAIPLGWPVTAGASDRFVYVGDCLNHRVVRVDKAYAKTVEQAVP